MNHSTFMSTFTGTATTVRVFSVNRQIAYEARVEKRAANANREKKEEEERLKGRKTQARQKPRGFVIGYGTKSKVEGTGKDVKVNNKQKETKAEYDARKAKRAADTAAYEERKIKREAHEKYQAEQKAAYDERCVKRALKAESQQKNAKRRWEKKCLQNQACFNCGDQDHRSIACPEPPYEGKY